MTDAATPQRNPPLVAGKPEDGQGPSSGGAIALDASEASHASPLQIADALATPRRGRRRPPVPLSQNKRRFAVAAWHAATRLGVGPYRAAHVAKLLFGSSRLTAEELDDGWLRVWARTSATGKGEVDWIVRLAERSVQESDGTDLAWMAESAGLLIIMSRGFADGDVAAIAGAYARLVERGWRSVLHGMSDRLSNMDWTDRPAVKDDTQRVSMLILPGVRAMLPLLNRPL